MIRAILLLSLLIATPAICAEQPAPPEVWKTVGNRITVVPAAISFPVTAGSVTLVKTQEFSHKGEGVDDVLQYESSDRAVFATAYAYYATYADTALAAYETDRAIRGRMGAAVVVDSETMAAAGGVPASAIRRVYEKGELEAGKPLTSAGAWMRAGRWLVVLRVSGPASRRAEIETALDGLLAGLSFDGADKPMPAFALKIGAPCPATEQPAKPASRKDEGAATLAAAVLGGAILPDRGKPTDPPVPLAFPANGASAVCVRGTIGTMAIFQPASPSDGVMALVAFNDAGGTLTVEPRLIGKGYVVKRYDIGTMDVLGSFDAVPDAAQLGAILDGSDVQGSGVRARTTFTPDGNSNVAIDSDYMK